MSLGVHRDDLDLKETFFPLDNKKDDRKYSRCFIKKSICRGCHIKTYDTNRYKGETAYCKSCARIKSTLFNKYRFDALKWKEHLTRKCAVCEDQIVEYPVNGRIKVCSDKCRDLRNKQWFKDNKDRIKETYKEWRKSNILRLSLYYREWRRENRDKVNARNRKSRERNREKNKDKILKRKEIRSDIRTDKNLEAMFNKQNGLCGLTQLPMDPKKDDIHIDHIIPLERDGTNHHMNLQLTHGVANCIKKDRLECELPASEFRRMHDRVLEDKANQ